MTAATRDHKDLVDRLVNIERIALGLDAKLDAFDTRLKMFQPIIPIPVQPPPGFGQAVAGSMATAVSCAVSTDGAVSAQECSDNGYGLAGGPKKQEGVVEEEGEEDEHYKQTKDEEKQDHEKDTCTFFTAEHTWQNATQNPENRLEDVKVDANTGGLRSALMQAVSLHASERIDDAVALLSKAIWLVQSEQVVDVPAELHSTLYSHRAWAFTEMEKWPEAEKDGTAAVALNSGNTFGRHSRAAAYVEMERYSEALDDIDQVLKETTDPTLKKDAMALRELTIRLQTSVIDDVVMDHAAATKQESR